MYVPPYLLPPPGPDLHRGQDPSDPISYLCAWLALVPQALCVAYAVLLLATREAEVALMFAGQMGCEALNFALKRLIREERPPREFSPLLVSCPVIVVRAVGVRGAWAC